ncbi:MAG: tetratricopeptide repeat protein [Myxococcales bacterium]
MKRLVLALALFACKPSQPTAARAPDAQPADPASSKALLAEVDRLKDQIKDKPKTFEVVSALGNLYYENGRYLEAVDAFREAEELSAPAQAEADALRKKGVKAAADLPAECRRSGPEYGLARIAEAARKLDPPRKLRCLEIALEMALQDTARRGNSFYLIGNPDAALAEHRRVLARSPDYPESLFFVGAILLEQSNGDKKQLAEGKKHWQRLLKVAPDSPRASIVRETLPKADEVFKPRPEGQMPAGHPKVAQSDLPPGHPPMAQNDLPPGHPPIGGGQPGAPMNHSGARAPGEPTQEEMRNLEEAVANTERTPELEKGLDELLAQSEKDLDQGRYQEARDAVVRVMPMRPNDPRTSAAMGGAMRGLGRMEMAQRTLLHALQLDPRQPRALYESGKLKAQQGDKAGASQSFAALKSADPKFARSHKVDEELAKLR